MTLATTPPLMDYIENGTTTVHAIPFQFQSSSEIICSRIPVGGVETPLVNGGDYTVSGGTGATGTVTKKNGGAPGAIFRVRRVTQQAQSTRFVNSGSFPAESVEVAFDRDMAVDQETDVALSLLEQRSLRGYAGDIIPQLPAPASRASRFMQWSADGKAVLLQSASDLAALLAAPVAALMGLVNKGDPGGNVASIGLFSFASGLSIPPGTDTVRTSGYSTVGQGVADYMADAAVDASYVAAHPRTSFVTANGRGFRLISLEHSLKALSFGFVPNDSGLSARQANTAAMVELLGYLKATAVINATYALVQRVTWPAALFYFDNTHTYFDVKCAIDFEGPGSAMGAGPATEFIFPLGGFRMNRYNTLGGAAEGAPTTGADGWHIRGIRMTSEQPRPADPDYATDATCGILSYCRGHAEDCSFDGFTLDNIAFVSGAVSGVGDANCNFSRVRYCESINAGRHGLYMVGSDTNAADISDNEFFANNNYGVFGGGFLASAYTRNKFDSNGLANVSSKADATSAVCAYSSTRYYVNPPNVSLAATTVPGTNTAVWIADTDTIGTSGPSATIPAWAPGLTWKDGGSFYSDNNTCPTFNDNYIESSQGQPFFLIRGLVIGGTLQRNPNSAAGYLLSTGNGPEWQGTFFQTDGSHIIYTDDNVAFGPPINSVSALNGVINLDNNNASFALVFRRFAAGAFVQDDGTITSTEGTGFTFENPWLHTFRVNGADAGYVKAAGFDLRSDGAYFIGGIQVLGQTRSGWSTPGGGAPRRDGYNTTTVTTEQLAEVVLGIITDLKSTGVFGP